MIDVEKFLSGNKCKLCPADSKDIDKKQTANFRKHLVRNHFDDFKTYIDEQNQNALLTVAKQTKINETFPSTRQNLANRFFMLYAATSTFPRNHLRNKHLKVKTGIPEIYFNQF